MLDAGWNMINVGQIILARRYDAEKKQNSQWNKDITDNTFHCILDIFYNIYIYTVIHRQTVSFYQNSSVWLDS